MAGGETQAYGPLSERELQIVELVANGLTNQEIAAALEISKRTVDNHISNILTKTSTDNRVALVRWALQWGKVCLNDVNCCVLPGSDLRDVSGGACAAGGDRATCPFTQRPLCPGGGFPEPLV